MTCTTVIPRTASSSIPSYEVRPRSWKQYPFSFLPWRKPNVLEVEIRVFAGYGPQSIVIKRRYLKRFQGKTLHVKIPEPKSTSILYEYWLEDANGSSSRVERGSGRPYPAGVLP